MSQPVESLVSFTKREIVKYQGNPIALLTVMNLYINYILDKLKEAQATIEALEHECGKDLM